jgi:type IV secretion system protein VirB1
LAIEQLWSLVMLDFMSLAQQCAPSVSPVTMRAIVATESHFNPYAIGVVGGRLARQPRNLSEAIATAQSLESQQVNFSIGMSQVNRFNLARYGLTYETAFNPCANLYAGSDILRTCYARASEAVGPRSSILAAAISCYYSGNFRRGLIADAAGTSYVQRVVANARTLAVDANAVPAIPVIMDRPTGSDLKELEGHGRSKPAQRTTPSARKETPHPSWDAFGDFNCDGEACR